MRQIGDKLVKEPVNDKKRPLFFVFAADSEQAGTVAVGGFEVSEVKSCKL